MSISRLIISPDHMNDKILVAIPDGFGLFISNESGHSWEHVAKSNYRITGATYIKQENTNRLLISTEDGSIFLSGNTFKEWTFKGRIAKAGSVTYLSKYTIEGGQGVIFIGTELGGLYKTNDLGLSFKKIPISTGTEKEKRTAHITSIRTVQKANGSVRLFVTMWNQGFFFSPNGGDEWFEMNSGLKKDSQADKRQCAHFSKLEVSPTYSTDGCAFIAGFAGLFKSTNHCKTWIEVETRPARNVEGLSLSPSFENDGIVAIATYDGGIYTSADRGRNWKCRNVSLPSSHIWDVSLIKNQSNELLSQALINSGFLSTRWDQSGWVLNRLATDKGWKHITERFECTSLITKIANRLLETTDKPFPTLIEVAKRFRVSDNVFLGTRRKGILRSDDGGKTWKHMWVGNHNWIVNLKMSPNYEQDSTVFASVRLRGVFKSITQGGSWEKINKGLSSSAINYGGLGSYVLALSPDYKNDITVYFGSADGLYMQDMQNKTWKRIKVRSLTGNEYIRAIGVSPNFRHDHMMLVSVKGHGLYRSEDRGGSFEPISTGLIKRHESLKLFRFSPNYTHDQTIYAASAEEVYMSINKGHSWKRLDRPVRYEDRSDYLIYSGIWQLKCNRDYSCRTINCSKDPNAKVSLVFSGQGITWLGPKGSEYGPSKVFIDGRHVSTIDQYSTTTHKIAPIFSHTGMPPGQHTITIEASKAQNKKMQRSIAIDAFELL